jgi:hypothetical protein
MSTGRRHLGADFCFTTLTPLQILDPTDRITDAQGQLFRTHRDWHQRSESVQPKPDTAAATTTITATATVTAMMRAATSRCPTDLRLQGEAGVRAVLGRQNAAERVAREARRCGSAGALAGCACSRAARGCTLQPPAAGPCTLPRGQSAAPAAGQGAAAAQGAGTSQRAFTRCRGTPGWGSGAAGVVP